MKTDEMVPSPLFEVNLGGIELTEKQALELEKAIKQTTLQYLARIDNGILKNSFELIPDDTAALKPWPDDAEPRPYPGWPGPWPRPRPGDPDPQPILRLDKRWWLGLRLLKLEAGVRLDPGLLRTNFSVPTGFMVEKISMPG